MLEEEFFVHFMRMNMGLNAAFVNATIKKLLELRHVSNISSNGLDIVYNIAITLLLVYEEFFSIQVNSCHGRLHSIEMLSLMTNLLLMKIKCRKLTIFYLPGCTVLKQSVHHVEW